MPVTVTCTSSMDTGSAGSDGQEIGDPVHGAGTRRPTPRQAIC